MTTMMTDKEKELTERSAMLIEHIKSYITSNPNWIYYFLNPLVKSSENRAIEECIETFPLNWEEYIDLEINSVGEIDVFVDINIIDESDDGTTLKRWIHLPTFDETVSRNLKLWGGRINELRANDLKEEIADLKKLLDEKEAELKKYENGYK